MSSPQCGCAPPSPRRGGTRPPGAAAASRLVWLLLLVVGACATASDSGGRLPDDDVLVVHRLGDQGAEPSYVVVASDGEELATLSPPAELGDRLVITAIDQAPDAAVAVITTPEGLATLDTTGWEVEAFLMGAEVVWRDPASRFLLVDAAGSLEAIDLRTLARQRVGPSGRIGSIGAGVDHLALLTVDDGLAGKVVDPAGGTTMELPEGDAPAGVPFDDTGELLLVTRSRRVGDQPHRDFLVSPAADPRSSRVWYSSPHGPTAAWGDSSLVVAEAVGGRVSLVTADSTVEIGVLPEDGVPVLVGDPASPGVLLQHRRNETSRWYHVDPAAGTLTPLPVLDGLGPSSTVRSTAGLLVLDDHDGNDPSASRVVAVSVADGHITELTSAPDRRIITGGALSDSLVVVRAEAAGTLLMFDIPRGGTNTIQAEWPALLSPDETHLAAASGPAQSRRVSLLDLEDGRVHDLTVGHPVAWLRR